MSEAIFQQLTGSISFGKRKRQKDTDASECVATASGSSATAGGTQQESAPAAIQPTVTASDGCPAPVTTFAELGTRFKCRSSLLRNLAGMHFGAPTPVQQHAIPTVMARCDVYAVAPTGSGKTLAFLVPGVIQAARERAGRLGAGPSVLVVCPTRELAAQTARVLKLLTPGTGVKGSLLVKATAAGSDFSKVDVLVATPLLLVESLAEHKVSLAGLQLLVLDEADKLFEAKNGFLQQLDGVLAACKECSSLSKCLFSATLPEWVEHVAGSVLQEPAKITVGAKNASCQDVDQSLLFVGREAGKLVALRQMAQRSLKPPVLVFVASKERARQLHAELRFEKIHCDFLCADQSQAARSAAVEAFRAGRTWLLIATDLVARGMDFVGVNTVVNYDFPATQTDYIHRVGRTGRAGRRGTAVTFFVEDDAPRLQAIADCMRRAGCAVPEWMLLLKRGRAKPAPGCISERHAAEKRARAHKRQVVEQSKAKRDRNASAALREGHAQTGMQARKSGRREAQKHSRMRPATGSAA